MSRMTTETSASGVTVAAEGPHCGVCRHVSFGDDWNRTPYCTLRNQVASIDVGDVCSAFARDPPGGTVESTGEGDPVEVHPTERTRGTAAPFYAAYREDERYGWMCGACQSLDVAVDPMGRFECNECENTRKPTEWDAAYL